MILFQGFVVQFVGLGRVVVQVGEGVEGWLEHDGYIYSIKEKSKHVISWLKRISVTKEPECWRGGRWLLDPCKYVPPVDCWRLWACCCPLNPPKPPALLYPPWKAGSLGFWGWNWKLLKLDTNVLGSGFTGVGPPLQWAISKHIKYLRSLYQQTNQRWWYEFENKLVLLRSGHSIKRYAEKKKKLECASEWNRLYLLILERNSMK